MKTLQEQIIAKQDEYIKLLGEELDELAVLAHVHGWKSKRYEQGKKIRDELSALKAQAEQEKGTDGTEEKLLILDLLRLNTSEKMYSEETVINIIKQVLKITHNK